MNFRINDFYHEDNYCGYYCETDRVFVFYGNAYFEKNYQKIFPKYKFSFLKQTHGNFLTHVQTPFEKNIEADAQWTQERNLALVIQTADCIPAVIFDESQNKICAIHAGWRGVENRIVPKSIANLWNENKLNVILGPHIQKNSFEVDEDVKNLLVKSTTEPNSEFIYDQNKRKYFVSLKNIVKKQLSEVASDFFLYSTEIDTFTNTEFCSFRRTGKNAGRNLSFIVLKE